MRFLHTSPYTLPLRLCVDRQELGDVVKDDNGRKQDDADERYLVDALLEPRRQVAADERLDGEEDDHAAVENGDR